MTFAGTHGIAQSLAIGPRSGRLGSTTSIHFAFVGDGPVKEALVADARARGIDNVSFHPQGPIDRVPPMLFGIGRVARPALRRADLSVVHSFQARGLHGVRPAGRSRAAGESARILGEAEAGVVVPPEDPAELAGAIRWLASHPREAGEMGRNGKEYAKSFRRSDNADELERLLLEVTGSRRRDRDAP